MSYYPLKFYPYLKETIWGGNKISEYKKLATVREGIGESWELSQVEGHVSVISNGIWKDKTLNELIASDPEGVMGRKVFARFGTQFPLLIKLLDAQKDLSVQVHPDDGFARAQYGEKASGKTEMAYVIAADSEAKLIAGFSQQIDETEYERRVANDSIEEVLLKHSVHAGDVYFIPPGRVHAYGGGMLLLEVQQTSDLTYRIYDYRRKGPDGKLRQLHTDLAKKVLDYQLYEQYKTSYESKPNRVVTLADCPYFTANLIRVENNRIERNLGLYETFSVCVCVEGEVCIDGGSLGKECLKAGETVLIPAALAKHYTLEAKSALVFETYMGQ